VSVLSAREAAVELGVRVDTVCDLIRVTGIRPRRQKSKNAFGLTPRHMEILRERLRPLSRANPVPPEAAPAVVPAP
jgi:hypothetical protein